MPDTYYAGCWDRSRIPMSLRGLRFDDYQHPSGSGRIAKEAAQEFVNNFTDHYVSRERALANKLPKNRSNIGKGLFFFGRNGTGKTTLAATILTELQYKYPSAVTVYFRFSQWKEYVTGTFVKEPTEYSVLAESMVKLANTAQLLVLDDIGQEHRTATGFTQSSLHELIRGRYESGLPTICTSNIDTESINSVYGPSLDSFQHDAFDAYPILYKDLRKVNK